MWGSCVTHLALLMSTQRGRRLSVEAYMCHVCFAFITEALF